MKNDTLEVQHEYIYGETTICHNSPEGYTLEAFDDFKNNQQKCMK